MTKPLLVPVTAVAAAVNSDMSPVAPVVDAPVVIAMAPPVGGWVGWVEWGGVE